MSGQFFGERVDKSGIVERNDQDRMNHPVVDADLNPDRVPVDTVLFPDAMVPETPAPVAPVVDAASQMTPLSEPVVHEVSSTNVASLTALLSPEESGNLRTRWNDIQGKFVDEPRSAVQQADVLVSEVVEKITQMFASEHSKLEAQWNQGSDVSTEDLRKALQRYRSFFNRLVV